MASTLNYMVGTLLVCFIVFTNAEQVCDQNGQLYHREILLKRNDFPTTLSTDKNNNILFFCEAFGSYFDNYCHLYDMDKKQLTVIRGSINSYSSTFSNGNFYWHQENYNLNKGQSDGCIYKYNKETEQTENTDICNRDRSRISSYGDKLYIICNHTLYEYTNGETNLVKEFEDRDIYRFAIDGKDTKYYEGLQRNIYMVKDNKTVLLAYHNIHGVTLNNAGEVHFYGVGGIYTVDNDTFKKLPTGVIDDIDSVTSMDFDKDDNIVYTLDGSNYIYILKRTCKDYAAVKQHADLSLSPTSEPSQWESPLPSTPPPTTPPPTTPPPTTPPPTTAPPTTPPTTPPPTTPLPTTTPPPTTPQASLPTLLQVLLPTTAQSPHSTDIESARLTLLQLQIEIAKRELSLRELDEQIKHFELLKIKGVLGVIN